jgi:hypothetical protein
MVCRFQQSSAISSFRLQYMRRLQIYKKKRLFEFVKVLPGLITSSFGSTKGLLRFKKTEEKFPSLFYYKFYSDWHF